MTLILLETVENIQQVSTIHVGTDVKDTVCLKTVTWLNPFNATFTVPSNFFKKNNKHQPLHCLNPEIIVPSNGGFIKMKVEVGFNATLLTESR